MTNRERGRAPAPEELAELFMRQMISPIVGRRNERSQLALESRS